MTSQRLRKFLGFFAAFISLAGGGLLERSLLERVVVPNGEISSYSIRGLLFLGQLTFFGLAVWFFLRRGQRQAIGFSLAIVIGACSFIGGIVGLEILLPNTEEVAGWRSYSAKSERNVLGFRGQPVEYSLEDYVVVLLGDSGVEAQACAYEWMPERRLQHYLNLKGNRVKVFTVGAAGYGQDQELLGIQEYFSRFRADLVIVYLTPFNDITDNLWPTLFRGGIRYPKPTFRLQDGKLIGPTEQIGESLSLSRFTTLSRIRRLVAGNRDHSFQAQFPEPYTPRDQYDGPVTRRAYPYGMSGAISKGALNMDRSGLTFVLTPPSPRIMYALDLMRQLLTEMDRIVSQHKGRFALFTAGSLEEMVLQGHEVLEVGGKYFEISSEQSQKNLEYITPGFTYFHIPVALPAWAVGPEDGHLNEHAIDEAMFTLADNLDLMIRASRNTFVN